MVGVSQAAPSPRPPSVERVLAAARSATGDRDPHAVAIVAREVVADERRRLQRHGSDNDGDGARDAGALAVDVLARLREFDGWTEARPVFELFPSVVNATGVLIHTNLGRASWSYPAIEAAEWVARHAFLLELDRSTGRRGPRVPEAEAHLVALTGAEAGLVVTNNAAAIALAIGLAGRGGAVAVSRGELVEIGGGVRIPEILRRVGARVVEVGTTNRTRVADFTAAFDEATRPIRVVLRVHPSNFVQTGFVTSPDARELANLAHERGAIVVDDLGSGALLPTERFGLAHEPTPRERLEAGADIVTFSGDKLVGGPQAGLIVGRADLIAKMRRDPLARAMRPDKSILAGVAATLALYRGGRAVAEIPLWEALARPLDDLRSRAEAIAAWPGEARATEGVSVVETRATVGGGSLPGETIPSIGLAIDPGSRRGGASAILAALRANDPAVIGRIERDRVILDLRTVDPDDDTSVEIAIHDALAP
jgi:L-seryl-tRNA(Ser) seleniumtransferase